MKSSLEGLDKFELAKESANGTDRLRLSDLRTRRKRVKNDKFSSELTCVPQKTWCSPNHRNLGIQSSLEIVSLQMS